MKLEEQVTSLELSKELKELGVKQESLSYWVKYKDQEIWEILDKEHIKKFVPIKRDIEVLSAFTVAELGEMLPYGFENYRIFDDIAGEDAYICYPPKGEEYEGVPFYQENTEANARAKMLIYLIENKLLAPSQNPKKGGK